MWSGAGDNGRYPRVLLEQSQERHERQAEPVLRDGRGAEVRHEVSRQQTEASPQTQLLPLLTRGQCKTQYWILEHGLILTESNAG